MYVKTMYKSLVTRLVTPYNPGYREMLNLGTEADDNPGNTYNLVTESADN